MTYLQLFLRFLKQNHAYHLFLYNVINRKEDPRLYDFKSINNVLVLNFLANPFNWFETKEGYWFWEKLYDKWDDAIREHVGFSKRGYNNVTDYEKIIKKLIL